jgi:hypothetical protein
MMACNSIDIRDGLLFVLGGAWQSYSLLNTPSDVNLVVLLVLEAGGVDVGHYSMHISAHDPKWAHLRPGQVSRHRGGIRRHPPYRPVDAAHFACG